MDTTVSLICHRSRVCNTTSRRWRYHTQVGVTGIIGTGCSRATVAVVNNFSINFHIIIQRQQSIHGEIFQHGVGQCMLVNGWVEGGMIDSTIDGIGKRFFCSIKSCSRTILNLEQLKWWMGYDRVVDLRMKMLHAMFIQVPLRLPNGMNIATCVGCEYLRNDRSYLWWRLYTGPYWSVLQQR